MAIVYAKDKYINQQLTIPEILEKVSQDVNHHGLNVITNYPQGDLAQFRPQELAAALNRLRSLSTIK